MSLALRLALLWLLLGLALGLVLRARLEWRRLPLLYGLSALPWLAHLGHSLVVSAQAGVPGSRLALVLALGLLLGVGVLVAGWRWLRRPAWRLALVPPALALVHALPLTLLAQALTTTGRALNAVPVVALASGTLFVAGLLLMFALGRSDRDGPERPALP